MDDVIKFEHYKSEKEQAVFLQTKKNEKICKRFKIYC